MPVKERWVRGSKNHNKPRIEFGVRFSHHKGPLPHSSAADTMLCVHYLWICAKLCENPQWVRLWNATFQNVLDIVQESLRPQVFNFKQGADGS